MNLKSIKYWFTLFSGILVVGGVSLALYAAAYMSKGHPPASGIVALVIVFAITPLVVLALYPYKPDILDKKDRIYKAPGYNPFE